MHRHACIEVYNAPITSTAVKIIIIIAIPVLLYHLSCPHRNTRMSVFGAAVLVTEASPKPQFPRRVARGSSPRHPRSGSSNLHVLAAPPRRDRREVSLVILKKHPESLKKYPYST